MNRYFCLFVLCSSSLRHRCHLGFFVEETHQRSDGSCLVPSAPRRRVPRVTREDCRSCREGCSAGGVSLGNTTIVSLPSVRWHLETFRVEESLNPEVCQGLALKDREQTSHPGIVTMPAAHHVKGEEQVYFKRLFPTGRALRAKERDFQALLPLADTSHCAPSSPLCAELQSQVMGLFRLLKKKIKGCNHLQCDFLNSQ